jgi:hypothetical protein
LLRVHDQIAIFPAPRCTASSLDFHRVVWQSRK